MPTLRAINLLFLSLALAACDGKSGEDDSGGGADDAADDGSGDVLPACTEPTEVACVDQLILDLSLHDDKVSDADVETESDGDDFVTVVDASAGGYNQAANNPWVYVKFTPSGAERVDLDDESALESMDWDMAMRRFIVRLNGGSSGPSCVGAAALLEGDYETLDAVPEGISFAPDAYYTDDCTIVNDSSGLPGSPQVTMGSWWEYAGCVQTTNVPHLIQLADGHVIKLRVETYYGEDQDVCNETGSGGDDGGIVSLRWQYLL